MPLLSRWLSGPSPRPQACVFAVTLAARLVVLARFYGSSHFGVQSGDMGFYHGWALRILQGQWSDHHAFYGLPGYAFLLAAVYWAVGVHPIVVFFLQSALEAATAAIIFTITRKILSFERKNGFYPQPPSLDSVVSWLAALGWIFFTPAQTFTMILMPTIWMICVFWFLVCVLLRLREASILRPWAILGVSLGLVATLVATILFLLPLALARIAMLVGRGLQPARRWAQAVLAAVVLFAGVFVGSAPVWTHNFFIAHDRVLLSAHGGINFWIGNYPQANGYPKIPQGLPAGQEPLLRASISVAETAAGRSLKRSEVSAYWSEKAWREIRQHPANWLRLLGFKVRNFWNAYSYDDLTIVALLREEGVLLPGIGFGVAAAFGLAGMICAIARNAPARWVAAAILLHMLALMSVFITERYRMAAVPGLLTLGGYGIWWAATNAACRRWQAVATYFALLAGATAAVYLPKTDAPKSMEAYNLAIAEMEAGQLDLAERHLKQAEALAPNNSELLASFGELYQIKGNRGRAEEFYRRALVIDPRNNEALSNLGVLAVQDHRWDAAGEAPVGGRGWRS